MKTLHQRCAGLDVHKQDVVACLRLVTQGRVHREVRRFPTTTRGLLELAAWLEAARCTIVAMEATGVSWKPVWHILDGSFELVLANAAHIKGVPGRKSDVNDATWIADLLAHGLIRASFVPPQPIQDLRDLTRTRKQLSREIVRHTQRLQAVLEEANVKLASVITDILGASGRRILKAMITGETDPSHLAELGSRRLGCSRDTLVEALDGRVRDHHRFLLDQHLKTIEQLEETMAAFDARIEAALAPFRDTVERLTQVPGLSTRAAEVVIAEIGLDMSRFPTAGHLLSWAGLVPALDESAGKRRGAPVWPLWLSQDQRALKDAGWLVNDKRVERIWRREGLMVPPKQPKRGRLWLADGSCLRLRPEYPNHVWSYDFVEDRTHDGRKFRMLNVIDEFTHECLAIRVDRKLKAIDVIDVLSDLFILRGVPGHIRSDNGPEFVAKAVQTWITAVGAKTAYIAPGSPWENGYVESFNARLRDELLNGEIFYTLQEAQSCDRKLAKTLQYRAAACLSGLQTSGSGGVRASPRRLAGCATPTGSAGQAPRSATTNPELTFNPGHPMGADHQEPVLEAPILA